MSTLDTGAVTPFAVYVSNGDDRALVRLIGELDVGVVRQAQSAIARAERTQPPLLEVDLSALAFMDSTGLRLMLDARERALREQRRLLLRRGPQAVQRVFELTSLASLFEFAD
jgi:anti-anti-sigma factor